MCSVEIDGERATEGGLRNRMRAEHLCSMICDVDGRAIRGLGLHLERLAAGCLALWGTALDPGRARQAIRSFVIRNPEVTRLRIELFRSEADLRERILIAELEPRLPAVDGMRLRAVPRGHEPFLTSPAPSTPLVHRRRARAAGFDDALVHFEDGSLGDSSAGPVAFLWGTRVIWPHQPTVPSIDRSLLHERLTTEGIASVILTVTLADLPLFDSCFVVTSSGPVAVSSIAVPGVGASGIEPVSFAAASPFLARISAQFAAIAGESV